MRTFVVVALLLTACSGSIQAGVPKSDAGEFDDDDSPSDDAATAGPGDGGGTASRDGGNDARTQPVDAGSGGASEAGSASDAAGEPVPVQDAARPSEAGTTDPGRDAGTPTPDAAMPAGTVPMFVAVGYGTRRIVSCDFGRTWKGDMAEVPNGGDDGTLVRGLAAGQGKFVMAIGGGGTQKLAVSEDGVEWGLMMPALNNPGRNGYSDVAYGKGRFVAGGGHISIVSSDGKSWGMEGTMGSGGILRNLTFGDYMGGRFVAVGDQGRRMSSSDGVTWGSEVSSGTARLHGVAYGGGVFVAITENSAGTFYSEDGGTTWQAGSIAGASGVRGILHDGKRFLVTTGGPTFTSNDGKAWQMNAASGGPASLDVSDDGMHYAGANGNVLYHSTDGINYMPVSMTGQAFTRVKFQRVKPSAVCPL
jgi:hypothetical protein